MNIILITTVQPTKRELRKPKNQSLQEREKYEVNIFFPIYARGFLPRYEEDP